MIVRVIHVIKVVLFKYIYFVLFLPVPVNKNRVYISSFSGRMLSDSPLKVYNMLALNKKYQIVIESVQSNQLYPISVKPLSIKNAFYLYTSQFVIANDLVNWRFKRNNQKYIQLWHGTPLKKICFDAKDKLSKRYMAVNNQNIKNIDFLISGNQYTTSCLKSAFPGVQNILEIGTPRNDIFFDQGITRYMDNPDSSFILMYAPTFRSNADESGVAQVKKLNPNLIISILEKKLQRKITLWIKFHPNVKNGEKIFFENNSIVNITGKMSMEDALLKTDFLITDYSSSFFDFALLKKPIVLFAYDYDSYINERGLYVDLRELPIPVAYNQKELISIIEEVKPKEYKLASENLLNYIGSRETGNATRRIVEIINSYTQL